MRKVVSDGNEEAIGNFSKCHPFYGVANKFIVLYPCSRNL
jgi:hypothetical protein